MDNLYTKFEKDILAKENKLLDLLAQEDGLRAAAANRRAQLQKLRDHVQEEERYFSKKYKSVTDNMRFAPDDLVHSPPKDTSPKQVQIATDAIASNISSQMQSQFAEAMAKRSSVFTSFNVKELDRGKEVVPSYAAREA